MKHVFNILLSIAIIGLGYGVFRSIMEPIEFKKAKKEREVEVVQRLKDIRTAEGLYKSTHGVYTNSFDSLINFLEAGQIPVVHIIPDPTDTTFTRTIRDTVAFIKAADSVYSTRPNAVISDIQFVPFTNKAKFELDAGTLDRGGVEVNVFEAKVPFDVYLKGLDEQAIINISARETEIERFPGLKVGSMVEPSVDGNWE